MRSSNYKIKKFGGIIHVDLHPAPTIPNDGYAVGKNRIYSSNCTRVHWLDSRVGSRASVSWYFKRHSRRKFRMHSLCRKENYENNASYISTQNTPPLNQHLPLLRWKHFGPFGHMCPQQHWSPYGHCTPMESIRKGVEQESNNKLHHS